MTAIGILSQSLDKSLLHLLEPFMQPPFDVVGALQAIHGHFHRKTGSNLIAARRDFSQLLAKPNETCSSLIDRLQKIVAIIEEQQGGKVPDIEKASVLLGALRERTELSPIVAQLTAQSTDTTGTLSSGFSAFTFDNVCATILNFETTLDSDSKQQSNGDAAFLGGSGRRRGRGGKFRGSGRGRGGRRSPSPVTITVKNDRKQGRPERARICYDCRQRGHISGDSACPERKQRTSSGRDRCNTCGRRGHTSAQCYRRDDTDDEDSVWFASRAYLAYHTRTRGTNGRRYVLDSAATKHIAYNKSDMLDLRAPSDRHRLRGIADNDVHIAGVGTLAHFPGEALLVPDAQEILVSIPQLTRHGWTATFTGEGVVLRSPEGAEIRGEADSDRLFSVPDSAFLASTGVSSDMLAWHIRLGHPSEKVLREMAISHNIDTSRWPSTLPFCDVCVASNLQKSRVRRSGLSERSESKFSSGERIHIDTIGPMPPSVGGSRYAIQAVDDATHFVFTRIMKKKSDAPASVADIANHDILPLQRHCKQIHGDRAGEFTGLDMRGMARDLGISLSFSAPDTPAHNGLAEVKHRDTVRIARALLEQSALPKSFWAESLMFATFLRNITPSRSLGGASPFELWFGTKPDVSRLLAFGAPVWFYSPGGKFERRAQEGYYLGPSFETSGGAARIWCIDTKRVRITRDFRVNESIVLEISAKPSTDPTAKRASKTGPSGCDSDSEDESPELSDSDSEDEGISLRQRVAKSPPTPPVRRAAPSAAPPPPAPTPTPALPASVRQSEGEEERPAIPVRRVDEANPAIIPVRRVDFAEAPQQASRSSGRSLELRGLAIQGPDFTPANPEGRRASSRTRAAKPTTADKSGGQGERIDRALLSVEVDLSYDQAISGPDAEKWRLAFTSEADSIIENDVFRIVEKPANAKVIGCRWVLAEKSDAFGDHYYKVRLCAKGFSQQYGVNYFETSAPVASKEAIRMVIAFAAANGWSMEQVDIKTAYLNAELKESVYMDFPPGFADLFGHSLTPEQRELVASGRACILLRKAIYGLMQAGVAWNDTLSEYLVSLGFVRLSDVDACVFVRGDLIIVVYVDDLLLVARDKAALNAFFREFTMYKYKRLGTVTNYVGCEINTHEDGYSLHQRKYIMSLGESFGTGRQVHTPMVSGALLDGNSPPFDPEQYRKIIGSLLFVSTCTRPDIAVAVNILSRSMSTPTVAHYKAGVRIVDYLVTTADYGIRYCRVPSRVSPPWHVEAYADAAYAPEEGDKNRRSRTGYVISMAGGPVCWRATKQSITALSTSEAEYVSLSECARDVMFVRNFTSLLGNGVPHDVPITIFEDNQVAKRMAESVASKRSKHIDVRFHHIRDLVNENLILITDCRTDHMTADLLTKPLPRDTFERLRQYFVQRLDFHTPS